jgi:DNA-binding NarL/FixJ family response regulator
MNDGKDKVMGLKIMIVDDHAVVREGLRLLLEKEPDMEVVAEAGNGAMAIQSANEFLPDVIVMDINMPDMSGIEATRRIMAENSNAKVLALSMESDRRFVVEVLQSGAKGYVLKDSAFADLAVGIRVVAHDEQYLCPRISEMIIKDYLLSIPEGIPIGHTILTTQEREIIHLIADGKNTKDIAHMLEVSAKTVDNQRHNIMKKLGLYSIASLTKYAVREGLTSLR